MVGHSCIYYNGLVRKGDGIHEDDESQQDRQRHIEAPSTCEFILGVDRELGDNFGVSATNTYRYINNNTWTALGTIPL